MGDRTTDDVGQRQQQHNHNLIPLLRNAWSQCLRDGADASAVERFAAILASYSLTNDCSPMQRGVGVDGSTSINDSSHVIRRDNVSSSLSVSSDPSINSFAVGPRLSSVGALGSVERAVSTPVIVGEGKLSEGTNTTTSPLDQPMPLNVRAVLPGSSAALRALVRLGAHRLQGLINNSQLSSHQKQSFSDGVDDKTYKYSVEGTPPLRLGEAGVDTQSASGDARFAIATWLLSRRGCEWVLALAELITAGAVGFEDVHHATVQHRHMYDHTRILSETPAWKRRQRGGLQAENAHNPVSGTPPTPETPQQSKSFLAMHSLLNPCMVSTVCNAGDGSVVRALAPLIVSLVTLLIECQHRSQGLDDRNAHAFVEAQTHCWLQDYDVSRRHGDMSKALHLIFIAQSPVPTMYEDALVDDQNANIFKVVESSEASVPTAQVFPSSKICYLLLLSLEQLLSHTTVFEELVVRGRVVTLVEIMASNAELVVQNQLLVCISRLVATAARTSTGIATLKERRVFSLLLDIAQRGILREHEARHALVSVRSDANGYDSPTGDFERRLAVNVRSRQSVQDQQTNQIEGACILSAHTVLGLCQTIVFGVFALPQHARALFYSGLDADNFYEVLERTVLHCLVNGPILRQRTLGFLCHLLFFPESSSPARHQENTADIVRILNPNGLKSILRVYEKSATSMDAWNAQTSAKSAMLEILSVIVARSSGFGLVAPYSLLLDVDQFDCLDLSDRFSVLQMLETSQRRGEFSQNEFLVFLRLLRSPRPSTVLLVLSNLQDMFVAGLLSTSDVERSNVIHQLMELVIRPGELPWVSALNDESEFRVCVEVDKRISNSLNVTMNSLLETICANALDLVAMLLDQSKSAHDPFRERGGLRKIYRFLRCSGPNLSDRASNDSYSTSILAVSVALRRRALRVLSVVGIADSSLVSNIVPDLIGELQTSGGTASLDSTLLQFRQDVLATLCYIFRRNRVAKHCFRTGHGFIWAVSVLDGIARHIQQVLRGTTVQGQAQSAGDLSDTADDTFNLNGEGKSISTLESEIPVKALFIFLKALLYTMAEVLHGNRENRDYFREELHFSTICDTLEACHFVDGIFALHVVDELLNMSVSGSWPPSCPQHPVEVPPPWLEPVTLRGSSIVDPDVELQRASAVVAGDSSDDDDPPAQRARDHLGALSRGSAHETMHWERLHDARSSESLDRARRVTSCAHCRQSLRLENPEIFKLIIQLIGSAVKRKRQKGSNTRVGNNEFVEDVRPYVTMVQEMSFLCDVLVCNQRSLAEAAIVGEITGKCAEILLEKDADPDSFDHDAEVTELRDALLDVIRKISWYSISVPELSSLLSLMQEPSCSDAVYDTVVAASHRTAHSPTHFVEFAPDALALADFPELSERTWPPQQAYAFALWIQIGEAGVWWEAAGGGVGGAGGPALRRTPTKLQKSTPFRGTSMPVFQPKSGATPTPSRNSSFASLHGPFATTSLFSTSGDLNDRCILGFEAQNINGERSLTAVGVQEDGTLCMIADRQEIFFSEAPLQSNRWYHIVVSHVNDSSSANLFVDGLHVDSRQLQYPRTLSSSWIHGRIGARPQVQQRQRKQASQSEELSIYEDHVRELLYRAASPLGSGTSTAYLHRTGSHTAVSRSFQLGNAFIFEHAPSRAETLLLYLLGPDYTGSFDSVVVTPNHAQDLFAANTAIGDSLFMMHEELFGIIGDRRANVGRQQSTSSQDLQDATRFHSNSNVERMDRDDLGGAVDNSGSWDSDDRSASEPLRKTAFARVTTLLDRIRERLTYVFSVRNLVVAESLKLSFRFFAPSRVRAVAFPTGVGSALAAAAADIANIDKTPKCIPAITVSEIDDIYSVAVDAAFGEPTSFVLPGSDAAEKEWSDKRLFFGRTHSPYVQTRTSVKGLFANIGGPSVSLYLLSMAKTKERQRSNLRLLGHILSFSPRNRHDFTRVGGHELLGRMLRLSHWTVDDTLLELCFRLCGLRKHCGVVGITERQAVQEVTFSGGVITDALALKCTVLDWAIWGRAPAAVQTTLWTSLARLVDPVRHDHATFNILALRSVGALPLVLHMVRLMSADAFSTDELAKPIHAILFNLCGELIQGSEVSAVADVLFLSYLRATSSNRQNGSRRETDGACEHAQIMLLEFLCSYLRPTLRMPESLASLNASATETREVILSVFPFETVFALISTSLVGVRAKLIEFLGLQLADPRAQAHFDAISGFTLLGQQLALNRPSSSSFEGVMVALLVFLVGRRYLNDFRDSASFLHSPNFVGYKIRLTRLEQPDAIRSIIGVLTVSGVNDVGVEIRHGVLKVLHHFMLQGEDVKRQLIESDLIALLCSVFNFSFHNKMRIERQRTVGEPWFDGVDWRVEDDLCSMLKSLSVFACTDTQGGIETLESVLLSLDALSGSGRTASLPQSYVRMITMRVLFDAIQFFGENTRAALSTHLIDNFQKLTTLCANLVCASVSPVTLAVDPWWRWPGVSSESLFLSEFVHTVSAVLLQGDGGSNRSHPSYAALSSIRSQLRRVCIHVCHTGFASAVDDLDDTAPLALLLRFLAKTPKVVHELMDLDFVRRIVVSTQHLLRIDPFASIHGDASCVWEAMFTGTAGNQYLRRIFRIDGLLGFEQLGSAELEPDTINFAVAAAAREDAERDQWLETRRAEIRQLKKARRQALHNVAANAAQMANFCIHLETHSDILYSYEFSLEVEQLKQLRATWRSVVHQITHERALFAATEYWSSARWHLDPTEGPHRKRLRMKRYSAIVRFLEPLCMQEPVPEPVAEQTEAQEFFTPELLTSQHLARLHEKINADVGGVPPGTQDLRKTRDFSATMPSLPSSVIRAGERVLESIRCCRINPATSRDGELLITDRHLYFIEDGDVDDVNTDRHSTMAARARGRHKSRFSRARNLVWAHADVREVHNRRFLLQDTALELFLLSGKTYLLAFESNNVRNLACRSILGVDLPNLVNYDAEMAGGMFTASITKRWCRGQLSNFEYLMHLNTMAGRSFNDLTQYLVFPFVLRDYVSDELDLSDANTFRDFSKPMGGQTAARSERFAERFEQLIEMGEEPYFYGSHYSNLGTVLHLLVRTEPFSRYFIEFQGGRFDVPDRAFHAVGMAWYLASEGSSSDVKELIPELFIMPEVLENRNHFDMGIKQNGERVADVVLPPWAHKSARLFIKRHMQALECEYVSRNLHSWIDLIFGFKQTGPRAVDAQNVFYPLTYAGAVDVDAIEDPVLKEASITQISSFGQTPRQLFTKPHPPKAVSAQAALLADAVFARPEKLRPYALWSIGSPVGWLSATLSKSPLALGERRLPLLPRRDVVISWGHWDQSLRLCAVDTGKVLHVLEPAQQDDDVLCADIAVSGNTRFLVTGGTACCVKIFLLTNDDTTTDDDSDLSLSLPVLKIAGLSADLRTQHRGRTLRLPRLVEAVNDSPVEAGLLTRPSSVPQMFSRVRWGPDTASKPERYSSFSLLNTTPSLVGDSKRLSALAASIKASGGRTRTAESPHPDNDAADPTPALSTPSPASRSSNTSGGTSLSARRAPNVIGRAALTLATTLYGHSGPVSCVTVSTEWSVILSGSVDGTCIIWDLNRRTYIRTLRGHRGPVTAVCISKISGAIVTVSLEHGQSRAGRDSHISVLRLWSINGDPLAKASCPERVCCIDMTSGDEGLTDNLVVAGLHTGALHLFSAWDLDPLRTLEGAHKEPVTAVAFNADFTQIISGDRSGLMVCWSCRKPRDAYVPVGI